MRKISHQVSLKPTLLVSDWWNHHHVDPGPKSITLPLSTSSLLNSTSIMDRSQVGSPFASCYPVSQEFPFLYFSQFIAHNAHSYFLALFRVKSQCLLLMFKIPLVWTLSPWPTSSPTVCLQPGVRQLHSCPISEKLRHTNTFLLRLFLLP